MADRVAGHEFDGFGHCLLRQTNTDTPCPIRWRDIAHVDMTYENQMGYAHYMKLNAEECRQVMQKAASERINCEMATAAAVGLAVYGETKDGE